MQGSSEAPEPTVDEQVSGRLPPWGVDDLPQPAPFSVRNLFRIVGPGAILLVASIGGGEWIAGPAIAVKYGPSILWFATVAILIQLIFNLEGIRYTLYTGEPILIGAMRLRPSSHFWSAAYIFLAIAQIGAPALAVGCASVLFAAFAGHLSESSDEPTVRYIAYLVIIFTVILLASGKTIERMLEWFSWVMVTLILSFLLLVNLLFVPLDHWWQTLQGFFIVRRIPRDIDLLLLGTFAATAGAGGMGNLVITNWYRDKGFGMGAKVGAISSAFSSREIKVSPVGKVFPITEENLARWRGWWRYVNADQIWLWMQLSRVYYTLLLIFTLWAFYAVSWGEGALALFKVLGFVAAPIIALAALQILRINTTLLPPEIRPSLWRRLGLIIGALFYGAFFVVQLPDVVEKVTNFVTGS